MGSASSQNKGVPGVLASHEIPLWALIAAAVTTPISLALWLVSLPFLFLHVLSGVILSGVTQRDWLALLRRLPPKDEE